MTIVALYGGLCSGVEEVYNLLLQDYNSLFEEVYFTAAGDNTEHKRKISKFKFAEKVFNGDLITIDFPEEDLVQGIDKNTLSKEKINLVCADLELISQLNDRPEIKLIPIYISKNESLRVKEAINNNLSIDEVYSRIVNERTERSTFPLKEFQFLTIKDNTVKECVDSIVSKVKKLDKF